MENDVTFESFDKFNRKPLADRLTAVISKFYPFYDEAFVLSLNAKFGSGKTTFLKMWEQQLKEDGFEVISINAWETDFDDEPLIPIISSLLSNIKKSEKSEKLEKAIGGALTATALITNEVMSQIVGVDINKLINEVSDLPKSQDIQKIGENIYKEYSYKQEAYKILREELASYIETLDKKPLIILVDELDRVRPDYAVRFLEAIKHIFPIKGVSFVLAVDREQLKASVAQLYGQIDFENYYARFITREVELAKTSDLDLNEFIEFQEIKFFTNLEESDLNYPLKGNDGIHIKNSLKIICSVFNFRPRQIEYLYRCFSQIISISKADKFAKVNWVEGAVLLLALFIANKDLYHKIGGGDKCFKELDGYLSSLNYTNDNGRNLRYILFLATSCYMTEDNKDEKENFVDIYLRFDERANNADEETSRRNALHYLARLTDDMGRMYSKSVFQTIYQIVEEWKEFIE